MLSITYIIVFIFCLAIASACVLIGHQFITTYNGDFHRNYFYYLVTFFAFAFYGIWGQLFARAALSSLGTEDSVIVAVAGFLPILGVPFLFISLIMLIKMAYSFFDLKVKNYWLLIHIIILSISIAGIWFLFTFSGKYQLLASDQMTNIEVVSILLIEACYFLTFTLIFIFKLKKHPNPMNPTIYRFVILMGLGLVLREGLLVIMFQNPWMVAVAILLYFASNFFPLFYLHVNADIIFMPVSAENADMEKLEWIFKKYQISKRERDIIEQICAGKTNQQIADVLFISLQTVKDHTHRIYSKIGINSRMKLVQMINT